MNEKVFRILVLGLLITVVWHLRPLREDAESPDYQEVVDALVDAGFELPVAGNGVDGSRTIVLTTDVNAHFARTLIRRLLALDQVSPGTPIDLYLRTEGGWEADAFAVIDTIRHLRSPVNVHAIGEVHSSGVMILAAATGSRNVYPNTILGFHVMGEDEAKIYEQRYLGLWRRFASLPPEWLARRDKEMLYFTAQDALRYKVADVVLPEPDRGLVVPGEAAGQVVDR